MGRAGLVVHGQVHAVSSFVYVKNSVCFGSIFDSPKTESLRSGLPGEEGVESRVCELLPKAQGPPRTGNRKGAGNQGGDGCKQPSLRSIWGSAAPEMLSGCVQGVHCCTGEEGSFLALQLCGWEQRKPGSALLGRQK